MFYERQRKPTQAGTAQILQLNRDTMTEITRLGVFGDEAGTFTGQLALAHTRS